MGKFVKTSLSMVDPLFNDYNHSSVELAGIGQARLALSGTS